MSEQPAAPVLRVVRGDATPEEVAALVAVLAARGGAAPAEEPRPVSRWERPQPRVALPAPGPGAWQAAARDARTRASW